MLEAIVPAFNEEPTIADVVKVLVNSGVFSRVLVVDDGSSDATSARAQEAGAEVLKMASNSGKGRAMLAGIQATASDPVAFFDADLLGIRPSHIQSMNSAVNLGYDMVCGVRDYGAAFNPWHLVMPLITGQRFVSRRILAAVPADCWQGYAIETAINHAATKVRARTVVTVLDGVWSRAKATKQGLIGGLSSELKMFNTIGSVNTALNCHGSCKVK